MALADVTDGIIAAGALRAQASEEAAKVAAVAETALST
jgi:hypothetical protein